MKNRKFAAFLAVLLVVALAAAGCSKKNVGSPEDNPVVEEDEEETDGEDQEEDAGYTFGFSAIDMENPYFITLENSIREAVTENGDSLITMDPGTDAQTQRSQITQMIGDGIDAIFLSPVNWESITPSLEELKEAGVKIINVDTQVKEMDYVDAYVGSDNQEAGRMWGERCFSWSAPPRIPSTTASPGLRRPSPARIRGLRSWPGRIRTGCLKSRWSWPEQPWRSIRT